MATQSLQVRRAFRITIDIETTIDPELPARAPHLSEDLGYQKAFVRGLLARPEALRQLLRAVAVDALTPTRTLLEAEYGWGRVSDQQLLQPIIAELDPAAQAYFTEGLEDGASAYYVECYGAVVKRFAMIEIDERTVGA